MGTPERLTIPFELEGPQVERLVVVGGDLEYLRGLPSERLPTHTEVRLIASVLRRLFVDHGSGEIGKLMQAVPLKPKPRLTVECVYLDQALSQWNPRWVWYAWSGGATFAGAHHKGFILASIPKDEHEPYGSPEELLRQNPLPCSGELRRLSVDDWLASTSMAVRTDEQRLVRVSRASVIKYIANRKGGVHLDPSRNLTTPKVAARRQEQRFYLLDHGLLRVGHLSGPEFEVVSMAQDVAQSDWAQELIRLGKEVAPDDFEGDPTELRFWTGQMEADGSGWATSRFGPVDAEGQRNEN